MLSNYQNTRGPFMEIPTTELQFLKIKSLKKKKKKKKKLIKKKKKSSHKGTSKMSLTVELQEQHQKECLPHQYGEGGANGHANMVLTLP